ncbi:MAG: IPT/TIG domain-containing protein [bacterium]
MKRGNFSPISLFLYVFLLLIFLSGCSGGGTSPVSGVPVPQAQTISEVETAFIPPPPLPPNPVPLSSSGEKGRAVKDALSNSLSAGWNTVSFPFDSLTSTSGFTYYLYYWDGAAYQLADPRNAASIDCTRAYYAYSAGASNISASGTYTESISSGPLHDGWNFIPFPRRESKKFSDITMICNGETKTLGSATSFGNPPGAAWAYARIYYYVNSAWTQLKCNNGNSVLEPWKGYWLYAWANNATFSIASVPPGVPPSISSIVPIFGNEKDTVTITGLNFGSFQGAADTVLFGDISTGITATWSSTRITCQVPQGLSGCGPVPVEVVAGGQTSSSFIFTVVDTIAPYAVSSTISRTSIPMVMLGGPFTVTWSKPMDTRVGAVTIETLGFKAPVPAYWSWSPDKKTLTIALPGQPVPQGMLVRFTFTGFIDDAGNRHTGKKPGFDYSLPQPISLVLDVVSSYTDSTLPPNTDPFTYFSTETEGGATPTPTPTPLP